MIVEDLKPHHVENFLSQNIRPADLQEWLDGLGQHPRDALPAMIAAMPPRSLARALVMEDGAVVCLWGCGVRGAPGKRVGTLWLIATNYNLALAPLIHRTFAHEEWPKIKAMAPVLDAFPSVKNTVHHKWLEHFGFRLAGRGMWGGTGGEFLHYQLRTNQHVL